MPRRLDALDPDTRSAALASAAQALRAGALVAFPTETVYGLGARARDPRAVEHVYALKGRPAQHPLIVHLATASTLSDWAAHLPAAAEALAAAFWPGPLTLVLRARADVPAVVTGGADTIALRVPGHPVALALLELVGEGVAAPSANRFGRISPTRAEHVLDEFADVEDLSVLDGGPCRVGLESTIVDLSSDHPRLLRPGGVSVVALTQVVGPLATDLAAPRPRAPGDHERHYAPDVATSLVAPDAALDAPHDVAVLARSAAPASRPSGAAPWLQLPDDPDGYAHGLYAALRSLERAAPRALWIERVPDGDAWSAVRDRLQRASAAGGGAAAAAPRPHADPAANRRQPDPEESA